MEIKVKILGAGSIGNHLAYACRQLDWSVTVCDIDAEALRRTRDEIFPSRYGKWDEAIRLMRPTEVADETFEVIIIGTPPDSHIGLALECLAKKPPRVLLIEKPLCTPLLQSCDQLVSIAKQAGTRVLVGYNHTLTSNTLLAEEWLQEGTLGRILTIDVQIREHWQGIFKAHPWISGPEETYLGYTQRGGGALAEHSHGLAIWQHFARLAGSGRIIEVSAMLDMAHEAEAYYDRLAQLSLRTETGLTGLLVQDVITEPAKKYLRIQGSKGYLDWFINAKPGADAVKRWSQDGVERTQYFDKTRPDDFLPEIKHIERILSSPELFSPISLEYGMETMLVIAAAIQSHQEKRVIKIDYTRPYGLESLI